MSIFRTRCPERKRKCHQCYSTIIKNEYFLLIERYGRTLNVCQSCLQKITREITVLNRGGA